MMKLKFETRVLVVVAPEEVTEAIVEGPDVNCRYGALL